MDCVHHFNGFKRLVLFSILCTFSLVTVMPFSLYGQYDLGLNDIGFGLKIQKYIDRVWKYYEKSDEDSLLDTVLDLKAEIESYTGIKIDVSKEIDKIAVNLKKKGGKSNKKMFNDFKYLIKKKEKKHHQRALCMEAYIFDQPNMDFREYENIYISEVKKEDNEKQQKELPLKFVVGVSLILGGAFVMFATPVCPILGYTGEFMMSTGFGMLLDQGLDIYQKEY